MVKLEVVNTILTQQQAAVILTSGKDHSEVDSGLMARATGKLMTLFIHLTKRSSSS